MIDIVPNWHPVIVHFPIALLTVAILSLLLANLLPPHLHRAWWRFGHWNLRLGYLSALLAAWFGWLAYQSVPHDAEAHQVMHFHRNTALVTIALLTPFFIASWFSLRFTRLWVLIFSLALVAPGAGLAWTAWLGGELVYRHGVGVERLPDRGDHDHQQDHDDHGHNH